MKRDVFHHFVFLRSVTGNINLSVIVEQNEKKSFNNENSLATALMSSDTDQRIKDEL